ncbi:hypothetical protein L1999_09335 [Neobacillus drentensis]|uniref:hypothetical protein n=1 Tax=Neobacillus drentensis TaxID=220684 RepID=UPI001F33722D|nr:hypothetical protein [Neobacillus drentensis]ULT58707.1 hypothetical protein L1999_09335 [Neobacillus drentensis]
MNKSQTLLNGWTLIAHKSYKLYSNENSYVLIDQDGVLSMQFTVTEQEFEIIHSEYDLRVKMIPAFKTIKVLNVPEEV